MAGDIGKPDHALSFRRVERTGVYGDPVRSAQALGDRHDLRGLAGATAHQGINLVRVGADVHGAVRAERERARVRHLIGINGDGESRRKPKLAEAWGGVAGKGGDTEDREKKPAVFTHTRLVWSRNALVYRHVARQSAGVLP